MFFFWKTHLVIKNPYTQCLKPVLILILKQQLGWYHIYGPPRGVKGPFEKWRKNGALFWRNCVKSRLVEFLDFPETSRVFHEAVGRFLKTWWKIGENAIQDQLQLVQAFLSKTEDGSQD